MKLSSIPLMKERFGSKLRASKGIALVEICLAIGALVLGYFRLIPTPTIPLLLLGWFSLWMRSSSWRKVGLSRPNNISLTLALAILIAAGEQLIGVALLVPFLERLLGESIDVSQFHGIYHNIPLYLAGLLISWTLAAFGEEMIIRGYLLNRVAELMEWKPAGWVLGLILTSLVFGFAHGYQGAPGIIENVLVGFLLGGLFLLSGRNLWLPILVHGLTDTIGFSLIFLGFPF